MGVLQRSSLSSQSLHCPRTTTHSIDPDGPPEDQFHEITVGAGELVATNTDLGSLIVCPRSQYKLDSVSLALDHCTGLTCADNAVCLCQPCEQAPPVRVWLSPMYLTEYDLITFDPTERRSAVICEKMEVCTTVTQGENIYLVLEDKDYALRTERDQVRFHVEYRISGEQPQHSIAEPYGLLPQLSIANVTTSDFGTFVIEVSTLVS